MENEEPSAERIRREHCCLAILRLLDHEPGRAMNERVLTDCLRALALTTTGEETRLCLGRLEQSNCIATRKVESIVVAELRQTGEDVAHGRAIVEGVLRPSAECPY